jgi:7-keto-8-aminopelargonate synthetase-like enzyme
VTDQVDIIMGTFSKSLASMGGFIAGEDHVVEYIRHFSRAQIFTAGLSPADVAAAAKALEILRSEPERRVRLWENARRLTQEFKAMGYDTGNTQSPVIPLIIGDQDRAFHLWHLLHEDGIFVNVVLPPAVPPGRALIRLSCMATHTSEHLDRIVTAFRKAGKTLGII